MSRVGQPRWAMDYRKVVPSKPVSTIKKDTRHGPAKPEKIEEMLNDPVKRKHLGPCCVSKDGMLRGEKKWGDGAGSSDGKGGASPLILPRSASFRNRNRGMRP